MVRPVVVRHTPAEVAVRVVRLPLRGIDDVVLVAMFAPKKLRHLVKQFVNLIESRWQ